MMTIMSSPISSPVPTTIPAIEEKEAAKKNTCLVSGSTLLYPPEASTSECCGEDGSTEKTSSLSSFSDDGEDDSNNQHMPPPPAPRVLNEEESFLCEDHDDDVDDDCSSYEEYTVDDDDDAFATRSLDEYTFVTMEDDDDDFDLNQAEMLSTKKKVFFERCDRLTSIHFVPNLDDYTEEEKRLYWISSEEKLRMDQRLSQSIIRMVAREQELIQGLQSSKNNNGKSTSSSSSSSCSAIAATSSLLLNGHLSRRYRGLEVFSSLKQRSVEDGEDKNNNSRSIKSQVRLVIEAVMDEQDRQWSSSVGCDGGSDAIAKVSQSYSKLDEGRAWLRAKQDEEEALGVYSRSTSFFREYQQFLFTPPSGDIPSNKHSTDDKMNPCDSASCPCPSASMGALSSRVAKKALERQTREYEKRLLRKKNRHRHSRRVSSSSSSSSLSAGEKKITCVDDPDKSQLERRTLQLIRQRSSIRRLKTKGSSRSTQDQKVK